MEKEKGRLKINSKLNATIKGERKAPYSVPKVFIFQDRSLNGVDCEFEHSNNLVSKIYINGEELEKDNSYFERKEKEKEQKEKIKKQKDLHEKNNDLFSLKDTLLPSDTKSLNLYGCDNFYLKFNKACYYDESEEKFFFRRQLDKNDTKEIVPDWDDKLFEAINLKHQALLPKENKKTFNKKLEWRLCVGLGGHSVYETSITLHHIYGIPYIPASSLKGVVRSYVIKSHFESNEERAYQSEWFCDLFGCRFESIYKEARIGRITFYDTFPISAPTLVTDIINKHNDYEGGTPPNDTNSPVPIFFLTVENTEFNFSISTSNSKYNTLLEKADNLLKEAIESIGIGAKTSVGYGFFE